MFSNFHIFLVVVRETREGWPLLTIETEANGDSKSTNVNVGSLAGHAGTSDFCPAPLAALVGPVENIYFFPHHTLFQFICPPSPAS
jgi:hypothetical protein